MQDRPPAVRHLYIACAFALGAYSIVVGLLLGMSQSNYLFEHYNPLLMRQLLHFFAR